MKSLALLGAVALISSSASAAFTGWSVEMTTVGARNIYKVFANFDSNGTEFGSSTRVLNVFDFGKADSTPQGNQIAAGSSGIMNAVHNDYYIGDVDSDGDGYADVFGSVGTWTADSGSMSSTQSQTDSFVTMQNILNGWGTALDPSFGIPYGPEAGGISPPNSNAGWYDATPGTQNLIGATFKVRLMQIARIAANDNNLYTANMTLGYAYLNTTVAQFGYGSFTIGQPAPGAIALLGLAGLVGRRRRA
ncbi:MAG: hypothetical protein O3B75_09725 [Planctomycetota bacterium]|nr:hypothetical protein [Planctomycetota bacterium]